MEVQHEQRALPLEQSTSKQGKASNYYKDCVSDRLKTLVEMSLISATPPVAVVESSLPGDVAELGMRITIEVDCSGFTQLVPNRAGGWFSLTFNDTRTWFSESKSPSEKRIRQFCNMFTILLIISFSPSQALP